MDAFHSRCPLDHPPGSEEVINVITTHDGNRK